MYLITQAVSWFLIQVSSKRLHLLKDKNMASKGNKQLQKAIALKEKKKKKQVLCGLFSGFIRVQDLSLESWFTQMSVGTWIPLLQCISKGDPGVPVWLQGFSKEIKLKKSLAEIWITTPLSCYLSHCNCYSVLRNTPPPAPATWPTPSCPHYKRYLAHSFLHPYRGNICPQSTSKCIQRPHSFPTNQQVDRCLARPLLALLWAIKTDTTMHPGSLSLIIRKLAPCVNSVSCLNKLVFSTLWFESWKLFFHPHARPQHEIKREWCSLKEKGGRIELPGTITIQTITIKTITGNRSRPAKGQVKRLTEPANQ